MKRTAIAFIALFLAALGAGILLVSTIQSPPRLFKRNAERKNQGYYMAEFEFKMESALYHLNNGSYWKTFRTLRRIDHELESLEGMVKMPQKASTEELIEFLRERQNAKTGAFMDSDYPFFTYIGPTANVLGQLENLSVRIGRPVKLKYPLRFLDEIRTPQQLRAYLDSFLYFQERWAKKFDGPAPYVSGVSELSADTLLLFERMGNYPFTNEWKETLKSWFYETQDPKTGFWGARLGDKDAWNQALDVDSTSHILKHFVGTRGELLDPKYPLRYVEPLAMILLKEAEVPIPEDALKQHEWSLRQGHAAKVLVRWLWPSLSEPLRERSRRSMPAWLNQRFRMYRPGKGGFAIDASSPDADIDATTTALSFLEYIGFIPATWERDRLRGGVLVTEPEVESISLTHWEEAHLSPSDDVNSVRVYKDRMPAKESWDDSALVRIVYPHETPIPDIMDLRQGLARYMTAAGGEFGNWTTKAALQDAPLALRQAVRSVTINMGPLNLAQIASQYPDAERFLILSLNRFQVPVSCREYHLKGRP
jgi:hypothetical protein